MRLHWQVGMVCMKSAEWRAECSRVQSAECIDIMKLGFLSSRSQRPSRGPGVGCVCVCGGDGRLGLHGHVVMCVPCAMTFSVDTYIEHVFSQ